MPALLFEKKTASGMAALPFLLLLLAAPSAFAAQSFSDLPPTDPAFEAAEFLKANNIISGYPDGTFRPANKVNRAEALKIIVAPLVNAEELKTVTATPFSDIASDAWFLPYVEVARQNGIIDGPPAKTAFNGANTVIRAEFFKMLEMANKTDPQASFSDISLPLSQDVGSAQDWFYPYMRYAIASSMTMVNTTDGLLNPGKELTRGEITIFLYRFLMYRSGRRTQALLSEAENEIILILNMLQNDDLPQASAASARAMLATRGALAMKPDEPVVKGSVKISEAFNLLVQAYGSGKSGELDQAIALSGEAWNKSAKALEFSPNLKTIVEQVQVLAKNMADSARAAQAAQPK
ncbi:MAG: S-layer homology domain-containing protein [Candidatus Peregrinibacteria bacterium]